MSSLVKQVRTFIDTTKDFDKERFNCDVTYAWGLLDKFLESHKSMSYDALGGIYGFIDTVFEARPDVKMVYRKSKHSR